MNGACDPGLGRCHPDLVPIPGMAFRGFVRRGADGRSSALIAHYAPGAYNLAFDPAVAQSTTPTGGATEDDSFAPDPCVEAGHMSYLRFIPDGHAVRIECGTDYSAPANRYESGLLFTSFTSQTYGSPTTPASGDTPGWGSIAAVNSGSGRQNAGMCGDTVSPLIGGIGYCDGPRSAGGIWANHLASYSIDPRSPTNSYIVCGDAVCRLDETLATCPHLWVWLDL